MMFALLVSRWNARRKRVALSEWGRQFGYRLGGSEALPAPLYLPGIKVECCLSSEQTVIVRFRTAATPGSKTPHRPSQWNVLARLLPNTWPGTGLRPAANAISLLEFFELSSYPSLWHPEQFVLFGSDRCAAEAMASSRLPALLPPDVGLLLSGSYLLLDFSTRAFEAAELERMLTLAEELVQNLPNR